VGWRIDWEGVAVEAKKRIEMDRKQEETVLMNEMHNLKV
jgi:hypothetical protein